MKALILAAGKGTRMGKYTANLPKGMLNFDGKPLIERQIDTLRAAGINEIVIATGYMREAIEFADVRYYHNPEYASTNMVETLFCAREEFDANVIVSYSDILFTDKLVREMEDARGDVVVAVDSEWRGYWEMRYGTTEQDLETLTVKNRRIVELGRTVESSEGIDYRYIGMIKFTAKAWPRVIDLYDERKTKNEKWPASQKEFQQGYMTDLLNELIKAGVEVVPCVTARQWLEFDTDQDYEITLENMKQGTLKKFTEVF